MTEVPREKQYEELVRVEEIHGRHSLGVMMNQVWNDDPKRLSFVFARYKFVGKMLEGFRNVLEIGCGDGFPSQIVAQSVQNLDLSDFDPFFINEAKQNISKRKNIQDVIHHDLLEMEFQKKYDAIYLLDVLEHIDPENEQIFLNNLCKSLNPNGVAIIGMPSLESQEYASKQSKEGHVNCKTGDDLKSTLKTHFDSVFLFSMNDEVIHTGFNKMAHYLMALCVNQKSN